LLYASFAFDDLFETERHRYHLMRGAPTCQFTFLKTFSPTS
jgi:hypothetical protein